MIKISIKKALHKIKACFEFRDITYSYGLFSIKLPSNHLLPTYQKLHRNYDRFLAHLAQYLSPNDVVLDVGANCGDTLASMLEKNLDLQIICIEPDEKFYLYLQKNVSNINRYLKNPAKAIKNLVGKEVISASLSGNDSTKRASPETQKSVSSSVISSRTLDDILDEEANHIFPHPRLIKSDVDGYDYDVINSAEKIIEKCMPILFFECDYRNEAQKNKYKKLFETLQNKNYKSFWFFDNFGDFLYKTEDLQQIEKSIEYIWRQNQELSTRTIYYFDVLCASPKDELMLDKAINDYIESIVSVKSQTSR